GLSPFGPFRRWAMVSSGVAAGLALLALAGWLSGLHFLASLGEDYIPMAPSTALVLLVLAGALLLLAAAPARRFGQRTALVAGLATSLWGALMLLGAVAGVSPGLDEFLVRDPSRFGTVSTGRMSPTTATCLALAGGALLLLAAPAGRGRGAAAVLAVLVALASL